MIYKELIEKRASIREFTDKLIKKSDIEDIIKYFEELEGLGEDLSIEVFTKDAGVRLEGVAGYRGNAFMAPAYFVILGKGSKESYIDAGFRAMGTVLKMTEIGLQSCFLTVEKSDMVKYVLNIESEDDVLALIACGYGKKEKKLRRLDIFSPSSVKLIEREGHIAPKISEEELVFNEKWGEKLDFDNPDMIDPYLDEALYCASLSPSFLNRQSYRFLIKNRKLIIADKKDEMTSDNDALINIGVCMFSFASVYNEFCGRNLRWILKKTGDLEIPKDYDELGYIDI